MTNNLETETIEELRKLIQEKQKVIDELLARIEESNKPINPQTGEQ